MWKSNLYGKSDDFTLIQTLGRFIVGFESPGGKVKKAKKNHGYFVISPVYKEKTPKKKKKNVIVCFSFITG